VSAPSPPVDTRTPAQVSRQVQDLAKLLTEAWPQFDPGRGASAALVGVFSRFTDIIIRRLNRVPDKNFLAFLDLLGASLLPPQPARVPLTFSLAAGSTNDALVPAGTQVAAPPAEGSTSPVVFETERELVVTAARLVSVFARDPRRDGYADLSPLVSVAPDPTWAAAFEGDRPVEHAFYVSHPTIFGYENARELSIDFRLGTKPPADAPPALLRWEVWDGTAARPVMPVSDTTNGLRASGRVSFSGLGPLPLCELRGRVGRWLCCRLLTPLSPGGEERQGMLRAADVPSVVSVGVGASLRRDGLPVEKVSAGPAGADSTQNFFPFGERPRYGDTFYFAHAEAFSKPGAAVTLDVVLANPSTAGADSPIPPAKASDKLLLEWEYWDGRRWSSFGQSGRGRETSFDTTQALTRSGRLSFRVPAGVRPVAVRGAEDFWLRARVAAGDYGSEARYDPVDPNDPQKGYRLVPATLAPPSVSSLAVGYRLDVSATPESVIVSNDFESREVEGQGFLPFSPMADEEPTLYLGFTQPAGRASFPNSKLSLFFGVAEHRYGEVAEPFAPARSLKAGLPGSTVVHEFALTGPQPQFPSTARLVVTGPRWPTAATLLVRPGETTVAEVRVSVPPGLSAGEAEEGRVGFDGAADSPSATFVTVAGEEGTAAGDVRLSWEYWNGRVWSPLAVRDETEALTTSGLVEFLAPADMESRTEFGAERHWLRLRRRAGLYTFEPRLRRVLLNTAMASQAVTFRDEVLGSSDASEGQRFRTTQAPVLSGQQLEVREAEPPDAEEWAKHACEEGHDALAPAADPVAGPGAVWVRWHEVTDFYASGPRDRHYVLDRLTGVVSFGDGVSGRVPPHGSGNVRLSLYRTGGGAAGNRPAGAVTQLKTTVPYVDKVVNTEAAAGGADAETEESLVGRMPLTLRHGGRAVTPEDYEDLARLASPDVARARCVPLYDLAADPDGSVKRPGTVSLVVVPRDAGAKPLPGARLVERVRDYVGARRLPVGRFVVVAPDYLRVDVGVVASLKSLEGAAEVEAALLDALARFLHPLSGGPGGSGWDFGRRPHKSDLYALLEPVAGVSHIETLDITETEDRPGAALAGRFLVYSGWHRVSLVFEGAGAA